MCIAEGEGRSSLVVNTVDNEQDDDGDGNGSWWCVLVEEASLRRNRGLILVMTVCWRTLSSFHCVLNDKEDFLLLQESSLR